jgi:hypothetical protein
MTTDTTFVLVHAAWADSSSWAPLSDQRQQRGHNAHRSTTTTDLVRRRQAVTLTPTRSSERQILIR